VYISPKFSLLAGEKKNLEVLLDTYWFLPTRHNSLFLLRFSQENLQVETYCSLNQTCFVGLLTESQHMLPLGSILDSLMTFHQLHQLFGVKYEMILVFGDLEKIMDETIMACVNVLSRISLHMQ
jgi:hypothetical protein